MKPTMRVVGQMYSLKSICLYQGNTKEPGKTASLQPHHSGKECELNKCNAVSDQESCILFEGKLWPKYYFILRKEKVFSLSV